MSATPIRRPRVPPMIGGRHANLVAVLKPTARVSKLLAIDVTYREGRSEYRMQTHYPIVIILGGINSCRGNWSKKYHVQV